MSAFKNKFMCFRVQPNQTVVWEHKQTVGLEGARRLDVGDRAYSKVVNAIFSSCCSHFHIVYVSYPACTQVCVFIWITRECAVDICMFKACDFLHALSPLCRCWVPTDLLHIVLILSKSLEARKLGLRSWQGRQVSQLCANLFGWRCQGTDGNRRSGVV